MTGEISLGYVIKWKTKRRHRVSDYDDVIYPTLAKLQEYIMRVGGSAVDRFEPVEVFVKEKEQNGS